MPSPRPPHVCCANAGWGNRGDVRRGLRTGTMHRQMSPLLVARFPDSSATASSTARRNTPTAPAPASACPSRSRRSTSLAIEDTIVPSRASHVRATPASKSAPPTWPCLLPFCGGSIPNHATPFLVSVLKSRSIPILILPAQKGPGIAQSEGTSTGTNIALRTRIGANTSQGRGQGVVDQMPSVDRDATDHRKQHRDCQ